MNGYSQWSTPPPKKSRKEEYQERYEEAKRRGESFFPYTVFKDVVAALLVFGVILALALIVGVKTEPIADPTSTTYNPRPEWYFLFFFQVLKYFPGWLEPVAVVGIPTLAILILLAIPFIDRRAGRHPRGRPLATGLGIAVVAGLAILTYQGFTSPLVNPPADETPAIALGKRLYRELACSYCHSISGRGGAVGPDLSDVGSRLDKEALLSYFENPKAMIPHSLHPKLQFTKDELEGLTSYLLTLGAPVTYSAEALKLFDKRCSTCHTVDGSGGKAGPDLSRVGSYRSQTWLVAFIQDPRSVVPGASMPGFQEALSGSQIDDLAAYMSSLKGELATPAASPTPTPGPTPAPTPTHPPMPSPTPPLALPSYSRDIQPIFDKHCIVCHGATAMGGLNLSSYKSTLTTGNHSPLVIPGNTETSILYQSLKGEASGIPPMPPGAPLSAKEIEAIRLWIQQGALEN